MDAALDAHFETADVVSRRSSPQLAAAADYARRLGEVETVLPGIYARTDHKRFPEVRVAAMQAYEPKAVLVAETAARFSFWTSLEIEDVAAAVPRRLAPQPGYRFVRRTVPEHLVTEVDGVRVTAPALTAIEIGPDAVDEALRSGAATLADMREALRAFPHRPGNAVRRRLLEESSENPWSAAERQLHRLLRAAGITDWRGNLEVIGGGSTYVIDVAFVAQRLAIEIDGRHYHGDATFESDRWRQNALVLEGWRVLRFTWTMIEKYPDRVIETVRRGLVL
jgi:very-short-patch-repair endonuclease